MKSKHYDFEHELKPPFRVDVTDPLSGHDEDGYWTQGTYPTFEEAVAAAKGVVDQSWRERKSDDQWRIFGEFGIVYDSQGYLAFDASEEYNPSSPDQPD